MMSRRASGPVKTACGVPRDRRSRVLTGPRRPDAGVERPGTERHEPVTNVRG